MAQQPNILFIVTDQQRADAMGCSGGWLRTPHLDRIAAEGVRFRNALTNSPVCIPARVSLATGRYPHNTGVWQNQQYDMLAQTRTWMQAVRAAGYCTSVFGKTHLHRHSGDLRDREHLIHAYGLDTVDEIGGPRASTRTGSYMTDRWARLGLWEAYRADYAERFGNKPWVARPSVLPLEEYADVYVGQQAKRYLDDYQDERPWFCWVSFGGPHEPWDAPEPYASMYPPEEMPAPCAPCGTLAPEVLDGHLGTRLQGALDRPEDEVAAMRANYAGNITLIDDQIGEILRTVEARGELDNTIIVFTSDHGEMNGDHGLIYKEQFLNGALRIPLIVRTPATAGGGAGRVSDAPVELFDVGPTLVELAGGALEHEHYARSLCHVLENPAAEHRPFAVSEIFREIMIMDRQWKMVVNRDGDPYLLFDQVNDPAETVNLVHDLDTAGIVAEMREWLFEHLVRTQTGTPQNTIK